MILHPNNPRPLLGRHIYAHAFMDNENVKPVFPFYTIMILIVLGGLAAIFIPSPSHHTENVLESLTRDSGYRICTDGERWKVQERSFLGGWDDDVWGGYMTNRQQCLDRIESEKKFHAARLADKQRSRGFKVVP